MLIPVTLKLPWIIAHGDFSKSGTHTRPVTNSPPLSFLTSSFYFPSDLFHPLCTVITLSLVFGNGAELLEPPHVTVVHIDHLYLSYPISHIAFSSTSLYAIRPIRQRSRSPDQQVRGNKVGREEKTLSWHILPLPFILA